MIDGFVRVGAEQLDHGALLNLSAYRNEYSPHSHVDEATNDPMEGELWADPYYGQLYSRWVERARGVYGITDLMPSMSYDAAADLGFLRGPFVRIPRVAMSSFAEVEAFVETVRHGLSKGRSLLLRGQPKEYYLNRSPAARSLLYGEENALEPSLTPSAFRRGLDVNAIMPAWGGFLQWIIDMALSGRTTRDLDLLSQSWFTDYQFSRFALGMAQHYGLPSSGLDVTDDLHTALFFALSEFKPFAEESGRSAYARKAGWDHPSVLYLLALPSAAHTMNFNATVPKDLFHDCRPQRQHAHFLHRGWGLNANDCARWIVAALYVDAPLRDFDFPTVSNLFPGRAEDPFADGLAAWRDDAGLLPKSLKNYLGHYYSVSTDGVAG